mmetsp:Transcript_84650/g.236956  ORF Transcript_84650/g.236956 Transcript_84650/m.236956 type:complete len:250 (-) Transcript_84650:428-1177(-)
MAPQRPDCALSQRRRRAAQGRSAQVSCAPRGRPTRRQDPHNHDARAEAGARPRRVRAPSLRVPDARGLAEGPRAQGRSPGPQGVHGELCPPGAALDPAPCDGDPGELPAQRASEVGLRREREAAAKHRVPEWPRLRQQALELALRPPQLADELRQRRLGLEPDGLRLGGVPKRIGDRVGRPQLWQLVADGDQVQVRRQACGAFLGQVVLERSLFPLAWVLGVPTLKQVSRGYDPELGNRWQNARQVPAC